MVTKRHPPLVCLSVLLGCSPTPILSNAVGVAFDRCVTSEDNRAALARAMDLRLHDRLDSSADVLIVPGYSEAHEDAEGLGAVGKERLLRAVLAWRRGVAPFILVTGGYNEAQHMKQWLLKGGVPEDALFVEPCALHSHTNLRNAGRIMLSAGLPRGLIVTSFDQAMYFGRPILSTFYWRCLKLLGYMVGEVWHVDALTVGFIPSLEVLRPGDDPLDP